MNTSTPVNQTTVPEQPAPVRAKRGALKARILAELQAAGKRGVRVQALAKKLGLSNLRLSVWFATTGMRPEIERISRGTYRLRTSCKRRGRLTAGILAELKAAGESGVSFKVIAESLQLPCHSVHCWHQGTGRRIPGVERIGRDLYRFNPGDFAIPEPSELYSQLTRAILPTLKAAGADGLRVGDLVARTGLTRRQVENWLATTGKKVSGVENIALGAYRFNPGNFPSPKPPIPSTPLTLAILAALKAAGSEGLAIPDLAARTGLTRRRVESWLATTGKKVPGVERIKVGVYRFNPGCFPSPEPCALLAHNLSWET